jgi:hypothetical protein
MWNLMARQWLSVRIQATPERSISCPYHNIYHDLNFYQQNNYQNKHKSVAILAQSGIITTSGQRQSSQKPINKEKQNDSKSKVGEKFCLKGLLMDALQLFEESFIENIGKLKPYAPRTLCQFDKIIIKTSTKVLICSFIQV